MEIFEIRDLIFRQLYEQSLSPTYHFSAISQHLRAVNYRLTPDIECDLCDELSLLGKDCCIKFYGKEYYIFDGSIYITIGEELIQDAFRFFMSHSGLKITERKRIGMCRNDFLSSVRINGRLKPRLDIVAFSNGVLDLSRFVLSPPDKSKHVMYQNKYAYDPKAKCPKWQRFLREVLPDKNSRVILQMFMGLGLMERGTVFNKHEHSEAAKVELCLILLGSGANGKSVIYQTAIGLFGADRISGVDYDELTSGGDEGMRSRRLLRDVVFNWSSDSDANTFGRRRTGVFKRIVSGEPVTDRGIGENVSQNFHLPYLIFNLNELPYPNDTSLGFIRRLQFVSFDVTIPPEKQNKALANELVDEYPGIFNWVVRGSKELKRRKFVFPSSEGNRRHILLAQLMANPVVAWVNAYGLRPSPAVKGEVKTRVTSKYVLECLDRFCTDNDVDTPSPVSIGKTLSSLRFVKHNMSDGKEYDIYGADMKDMRRPFIIRNEMFDSVYREEEYLYINKED